MFKKYSESGYSVIPTYQNGKNPTIVNWQRYCKEKPTIGLIDSWDASFHAGLINIGLACGEASGVIGLDIDTDDPEVMKLFPPSPVVKRGAKGETRFFRYSKDIKSMSMPMLDILSDGRQTIIPPSIHPVTGEPYRWLTPDTLLDRPELPELDLSFLAKFRGSSHAVVPVSGRNNKLVDIITSMRGRGEPEQRIIDEVYTWDLENHKPRLFTDSLEGYKAKTEQDARACAWRMVMSVTSSLLRNNPDILVDQSGPPAVEVNESELDKNKFKAKEFPEPKGLLLDIQELINGYSIRDMPNLALGGAIALVGALACNRFRVGNIWPNVYVINLAPTGAGKSFPQSIIKMVLADQMGSTLLGFGDYRSGSALTKNLVSRRERLDIVDEVSGLFAQMKDGGLYQTEIQTTLCKLWSESNQLFLGAEYAERADTSSCYNPCVNLLGSATIEGLKSNMNKKMLTGGLVPRLLLFSHEGYGRLKDSVLRPDIMARVVAGCKTVYSVPRRESKASVDIRYRPIFNPIDLYPDDPNAVGLLAEILKDYNDRVALESSNETVKNMLTRAGEQVMKLALIHCIGCFRVDSNRIQIEDIEWARKVFDVCLHNGILFIEETATDGRWEQELQKLTALFKRHGFLSRRDIVRGIRVEPLRLKALLDSLVAGEVIQASVRKTKTKSSQGFQYIT